MCYRSIWPVKLMQNINKCHNKTDICHIVHSHERVPKWTLFISWCNSATSLKIKYFAKYSFPNNKEMSCCVPSASLPTFAPPLGPSHPQTVLRRFRLCLRHYRNLLRAESSLRSYLLYLTKFLFCSLPKCLRTSRWGLSHTLPTSGTPGVKII